MSKIQPPHKRLSVLYKRFVKAHGTKLYSFLLWAFCNLILTKLFCQVFNKNY